MRYERPLKLWFLVFSSTEFPDSKPTLWTESDRYEPGDVLRANCSSPPSKPKADLTLTVNNVVVSHQLNLPSQVKAPNCYNIYLQMASKDKILVSVLFLASSSLFPSLDCRDEKLKTLSLLLP